MKALKIKNLDQLYKVLKDEAGQLKVHGYDSCTDGISYNCGEYSIIDNRNTLLHWFIINLSTLKGGCKNLIVAFAYMYERPDYVSYADELRITTTPTNSGLLVELERDDHNGHYDGNGHNFNFNKKINQVFLLKYE